jgi:predicted chitinase
LADENSFELETFARALIRLWPHGDAVVKGLRGGMIAAAGSVFAKYGCGQPIVICHAMAQFSEETGCGLELAENMNYSAGRLLVVFPTHFNPNEAINTQHQPRPTGSALGAAR